MQGGEPLLPRLYGEMASWFHLLTAPEEYEEEAALYRRLIEQTSARPVSTVLELGSGGGNNASHLKARFDLTLVDYSEPMLRISRELNPECEHIQGDMRTIRLDRQFDSVFVHDAVSYMTTELDLEATAATAFAHCHKGGVAIFVPDYVAEKFDPTTYHGGHDGGSRALRYLEWDWDPNPDDTEYFAEFAYLIREGGEVRIEHERHTCGIFPTSTWVRLLEDAGFRPETFESDIDDDQGRVIFAALKPA